MKPVFAYLPMIVASFLSVGGVSPVQPEETDKKLKSWVPENEDAVWTYKGKDGVEAWRSFREFIKTSRSVILRKGSTPDEVQNLSNLEQGGTGVFIVSPQENRSGLVFFVEFHPDVSGTLDDVMLTTNIKVDPETNRKSLLELVNRMNDYKRKGGLKWYYTDEDGVPRVWVSAVLPYKDELSLRFFEGWAKEETKLIVSSWVSLPPESQSMVPKLMVIDLDKEGRE